MAYASRRVCGGRRLSSRMVTGTLAKFATDIKLMMQTEVGEASEPAEAGRGTSSTMPQKRNPVACNFIVACARVARQNAASLMEAMVQDHERASGPWLLEWVALPEIFLAASGALYHARNFAAGLHLDEKRMRENLDATGGLISSEAVMMALAPHLGRERAHELVSGISRQSHRGEKTVPRVARRKSRGLEASRSRRPREVARPCQLPGPCARDGRPRAAKLR